MSDVAWGPHALTIMSCSISSFMIVISIWSWSVHVLHARQLIHRYVISLPATSTCLNCFWVFRWCGCHWNWYNFLDHYYIHHTFGLIPWSLVMIYLDLLDNHSCTNYIGLKRRWYEYYLLHDSFWCCWKFHEVLLYTSNSICILKDRFINGQSWW